MVCPMRVFVGLGSCALLLSVGLYMLYSQGDAPDWLSPPRAARSWRGFAWALFSGELLWAWWAARRAAREAAAGEAGAGEAGAGGGIAEARRKGD